MTTIQKLALYIGCKCEYRALTSDGEWIKHTITPSLLHDEHLLEIKPILRPLEAMTEDEWNMLFLINGCPFELIPDISELKRKESYRFSELDLWSERGKQFTFLLSKGFDLGLLSEGEYILETK